jgi:hypothetical protein
MNTILSITEYLGETGPTAETRLPAALAHAVEVASERTNEPQVSVFLTGNDSATLTGPGSLSGTSITLGHEGPLGTIQLRCPWDPNRRETITLAATTMIHSLAGDLRAS